MRPGWTEVAYRYDGSFAGFLSCVFDSYRYREAPAAFSCPEEDRVSLYPERPVETDAGHARRVFRSLKEKISPEAQRLASHAFLTCLPERECAIWRFIEMGYDIGPGVTYWLTDQRVAPLMEAVRHLYSEAHLLKGFARFSDTEGVLAGEIAPKNRVLPLLRRHFCDRFHGETFLLYDRTHCEVLLHHRGQWAIRPLAHLDLPPASEQEAGWQQLWQRFYHTVAIEDRYNPRLRMSNVPKRYWKHMTELRGELEGGGAPSPRQQAKGALTRRGG